MEQKIKELAQKLLQGELSVNEFLQLIDEARKETKNEQEENEMPALEDKEVKFNVENEV